jgi:UDP-N-acetylglucosamine--N-acetylmuramyl-(pentapeptide) pyrophosphoryl-undecaprenol N-acetylglucosamine transferase
LRILLIPFAPSLAHVSRCLAVAEACQVRGHRICFGVGAERIPLVESAGFNASPLPEVSGSAFRSDRGWNWLNPAYVEQNLKAEAALIADFQPEAVIFDFRFTSAAAARLAGVPSASILHGNGLRLALQPAETARLLLGDPLSARGIAAFRLRFLRQAFPLGFRAILGRVARRINPLLNSPDRPAASTPFELLLADKILIGDIPALLPPGLPEKCILIGPLRWSGWDQPAAWLEEFDERPLIYVTMGSTVEAGSILIKIIAALRDAPYNVIVTTGGLALPGSRDLPGHIHIFPTVPGLAVSRRSKVVVHHGGHETLLQALEAGVPSLAIPSNPDQILVSQQVQALGLGHSLWQPGSLPFGRRLFDKMTPAQVRQHIEALLADRDCQLNCQALAREITSYRGGETAARIIEAMI